LILAVVPALSGCNIIFNLFDNDPPPDVSVPPRWPGDVTGGWDTPNGWRTRPNNTNNRRFPPIVGTFRVGNAANTTLTVRVRPLKPTVRTDCDTLLAKPELALSRKLFGFAQTWVVPPGRAIPLLPTSANAAQGCAALLVDGSDLAPRLVVWRTKSEPPVSQPSTVGGSWPERLIGISAGESGFKWPDHANVHPQPIEFHPPLAEVCKQPDETVGVAWTEPLPQGDVTVIDVAEAPDGCRMIDLFGKLGTLNWVLCTPPGSFPFKVGESFFANPLQSGHDLGAIAGVELLSKGFRLRVGRGEETVYFGKGDAELGPVKGCGLNPAECGGQERPLELKVTAGGVDKTLRAGGKLELEKGRTLYLMRARELPIADLKCIPGGKPFNRQVESVYVEVQ